MSKIDLHIHTQKCKSGDPSERKISPIEFIKKMHENDVCICAITNHNKFDIKEFEEIKALDEKLTIFPGIELDVIDENNHFHIVVVCNPDRKKEFYKIFDNEKNRKYDEFSLNADKFFAKIHQFKNDEIVIIPHYGDKDKKRSITEEFKKTMTEVLEGYVTILEPGKLRTMGIIINHNDLAIIGSDVQDWQSYSSYPLPEIKFKVDTFKKFIELAKDTTLLNKMISDLSFEKIDVEGNQIVLHEDINIIFGEKGSGKTILLEKAIYPFYEKSGKKTIFHKGAEYQEKYEELLNEKILQTVIDEEKQEKIIQLFGKITEYKEDPIKNFKKIYIEHREKESNGRNKEILKKSTATYLNTANDFDDLKRDAISKVDKVSKVQHINNDFDRDEANKKRLSTELSLFEKDIFKKFELEFQESFTVSGIRNFLNTFKGSVDRQTGTKSKPTEIGFATLVNKRLNRLRWNKEINQLLNLIQSENIYKLGKLPGKGEVSLTVKIMVLSDEKYTDSPFEKNSIRSNRDIMSKIREFSIEEFSKEINNYFSDAIQRSSADFISQVIRVYPEPSKSYGSTSAFPGMFLKNAQGEMPYSPSEGEKSILSIVSILENTEYDCYIFDEMERGLGNKYIADYIIPKMKELRDMGKTLIISTHNANIAISSLPSQTIYCRYPNEDGYYMTGNMFENILTNYKKSNDQTQWDLIAIEHLEGNESMFNRRENIWK